MTRDNRDIAPDKLIRTQERARLDELAAVTEPHEITTSTGTTVSLRDFSGRKLVMLDNPEAPDGIRVVEVGRVIGGGFQPAPFCAGAIMPETLRAIATLIELEG